MPMLWNAVRPDTLVAFNEEIIRLRFAARPAYAAQGVGDDAVWLDQSILKQGDDGQQNTGRIATGRCDEQGFLDFLAIDLGQAINRFFQQLRRGMIVRVKFLVDFRAFEPE